MHSKTELVQIGSSQYTKEVRVGLQPMRKKEKGIQKKEIGSDWIWSIYKRSADRLATNENEGEVHSKTELVHTEYGQYTKERQPGLDPKRIKEKCIQKMELVQTGSGQYTEEVETALQPMSMKVKCI
jgi:hypothetical protein